MDSKGGNPGTRQTNLKKSFKLGVRSLLTACSKEEFCKAFSKFSPAEQERLHRLFIQVVSSLHENIEALSSHGTSSTTANTLLADCKTLIEYFQEFKITHVMREGNRCADFLANLGQDSPKGTIILEHPPDGLSDLLARDSQSFATCRRR